VKKSLFLLVVANIFYANNVLAEEFSWTEYKKTLPASIIEQNDKTKAEQTKENIKKRYDVDVDRRTLEDIKRDQASNNLTISVLFRQSKDYVSQSSYFDGITYTDEVISKTSTVGISITGRFDLISIGKKYTNTYANIDVFEDSIWMGLSRRIQAYNRLGLFSDVGAGLFFQTQDTTRKSDMYLYGYFKLGYNFEDWNVKVGINVPSDSFNSGFVNSSVVNVSLGWRF